MKFFVNLPLSWVYHDSSWLERLFSGLPDNEDGVEFGPELGIDEESFHLPLNWHKKIAARIAEHGATCSAHLPFFMLPPGNVKYRVEARKSLDILCKAAEIASLYSARHLVGHPGYDQDTDACGSKTLPPAEAHTPAESWLKYSTEAWNKVAAISPARLFLENTHERHYTPLVALLNRFDPNKIALCFDIGHWHAFAGGCVLRNLEEWITNVKPYLGHLHLHDNDGTDDQHIGLGCGKIPLASFFALLFSLNLHSSFTLEPHEIQSFQASIAWIKHSAEMRLWMKQ